MTTIWRSLRAVSDHLFCDRIKVKSNFDDLLGIACDDSATFRDRCHALGQMSTMMNRFNWIATPREHLQIATIIINDRDLLVAIPGEVFRFLAVPAFMETMARRASLLKKLSHHTTADTSRAPQGIIVQAAVLAAA